MAIIRIFPHSSEEFPSGDDLATWLMTALKARNGVYLLRSSKWASGLQIGSIVLFRYGEVIVGEAVIGKETTIHSEPIDGLYEASVSLSPSSIRLFVPAIPVDKLGPSVGRDLEGARPYYKFEDWGDYPKLLATHMGNGGSFL